MGLVNGIVTPSLAHGLTKRMVREAEDRLRKLDSYLAQRPRPKNLTKRHKYACSALRKAAGDLYIGCMSDGTGRRSITFMLASDYDEYGVLEVESMQMDHRNPSKREVYKPVFIRAGISRHCVERYFERVDGFELSDVAKTLGTTIVGAIGTMRKEDTSEFVLATDEGLLFIDLAPYPCECCDRYVAKTFIPVGKLNNRKRDIWQTARDEAGENTISVLHSFDRAAQG